MEYEIVKNSLDQDIIKAISDEGVISWIPADPANSDYQRYLNPEVEHLTEIVTNGANQ